MIYDNINVILSDEAEKNLGRLPKNEQAKVTRRLSLLETDPYAGKNLEGKFKDRLSLKAWPYRIIYRYSQEKATITIVSVRHRQSAY